MSTSTTFKKKKTLYFLEKHQIIPGRLIVSELSDAAFRLWAYLNALPETWEVQFKQIKDALRYGKDKLADAIDELCDHGYMKKFQERSKGGLFNKYVYEFCELQSFLKKCSPLPGFPLPDKPLPDNQHLSSYLKTYTYEEEVSNSSKEEDGVPPSQEEEFVPFSNKCYEKKELLEAYGLIPEQVNQMMDFDLDRIENACEAFKQWKKKIEEKGGNVADSAIALISAIHNHWKPNTTKDEIVYQEEKRREDKYVSASDRRIEVLMLYENNKDILPFEHSISVSDTCVQIRNGRSFHPISFNDANVVDIIKSHISAHTLKGL